MKYEDLKEARWAAESLSPIELNHGALIGSTHRGRRIAWVALRMQSERRKTLIEENRALKEILAEVVDQFALDEPPTNPLSVSFAFVGEEAVEELNLLAARIKRVLQ